MKYPLVRVEQRWAPGGGAAGESIEKLVSEEAVVADHLLLGVGATSSLEDVVGLLNGRGLASEPVPQAGKLVRVTVPDALGTDAFDQLRAELASLGQGVAYVEADALIFTEVTPNDPRYSAQWGLRADGVDAPASIGADLGWSVRTDASAVVVAITDTGMRTTHEDLTANLWANASEVPGNGVVDDGNGVIDDVNGFNAITVSGNVADDNGHGTHVAGIAGARGNNARGIAGVAWSVRLMPIKFLGSNGAGVSSDAVSAINYALNEGADLINASWSTTSRSQSLEAAIAQAGAAGVVVVAAAGNQASDLDAIPRYPAAFDLPTVVSVAASARNRAFTAFSNYGRDRVDLAAPGEGILSTYHRADDQYALLSGTSMAAPMVTGALALLKAEHPSDDALQLIQRLLGGARIAPSLEGAAATGGILHLPTLLQVATSTPRNDSRGSAYPFDGYQGVWSGSTLHAARGPDDPAALAGDRTVWFSWTAPVSGYAQWRVDSSDPATYSALFRSASGVLSALTTGSGTLQSVRQWVDAGEVYFFGVGGSSSGMDAVTVNLSLPPANDQMADAEVLTGEGFTAHGNNRGATREPGEPRHARVGAGRSVWWSWTAPRSTRQIITTLNSSFDTVLAVYRRGASGALVSLASNDDSGVGLLTSRVALDVTEGEEYLIAVDSWSGDSGSGRVLLSGYGLGNIVITEQPRDTEAHLGSSITMRVGFLSSLESDVRWFKDGQPIGGGRDGKLFIGNVRAEDLGSYHATIANADESVTSSAGILSELVSVPYITWVTGNLSEVAGNAVTLRATVIGSQPLTYQWLKNGEPLPGATADNLYFGSLSESDAGQYELVATNAAGSVTSKKVNLRVVSSPLGAWSWVTTPGQGWSVNDLLYFNDTYYALASADQSIKVLTSTDAKAWSEQLLPPAFEGFQMAGGNGVIIIAGRDETPFGNGSIYRSTDNGVTWSLVGLPFRGTIPRLEFGNGRFVTLTNHDGTLKTSTDGLSWQAPVTPPPNGITKLFFQGGLFFALKSSGSTFYISSDAQTWTAVTGPTSFAIYSVAYNDGDYLLWDAYTCYRSADGVTWETLGSSSYRPGALTAHTGTRLVTASDDWGALETEDGLNWTKYDIIGGGPSTTNKALLCAGGRTLIGGASGLIMVRDNDGPMRLDNPKPAFTWVANTSSRIEYSEGEFIASTRAWDGRIALSGDGVIWRNAGVPSQSGLNNRRIWKAGGYYWANTLSGLEKTFWRGRSLAGLSRVEGSPPEPLSGIVYFNNQYIAVAGSRLITSTDGEVWNDVDTVASGSTLHLVGGRCFRVGYGSLSSTQNGVDWSPAVLPAGVSGGLVATVVENNGKFYVATTSSRIWESADAVNWSVHTLPFSTTSLTEFYSHRGALMFLIYPKTTGEQIVYTTDLSNWQTLNTGISASYFATANGVMVGVSPTGQIVRNGEMATGAPLCRITYPRPGSTFALNKVVDIAVEIEAPDNNLDRVELYVDDVLVTTTTQTGVLKHRIVAAENRNHVIEARALNDDGRVTGSTAIFSVDPVEIAPRPPVSSGSVNRVFSLDGNYYAIGSSTVHRSSDGVTWESLAITGSTDLAQGIGTSLGETPLVFNVGNDVITSLDGQEWTRLLAGSGIRGPVEFASGVYARRYTTSNVGTVTISVGGNPWTGAPVRADTYFTNLLMGDGPRFVAWGSTVLNPTVRRSEDGFNWETIDGMGLPRVGVRALGRFMLLGTDNHVRTSVDGVEWTDVDLGFAATRLVEVGERVFAGDVHNFRAVSADGVEWTPLPTPLLASQLVHGDGRYLSVSFGWINISEDGLVWTPVSVPWTSSIVHLVHGPAGFLMMNSEGMWVSDNGVDWTATASVADAVGMWQGFVSRDNIWLGWRDVTATANPVMKSIDSGQTWTPVAIPFGYPVKASRIYSTGTEFVLQDSNRVIYRSTDGETWTVVPVVVDGVSVSPLVLYADGDHWRIVANDSYIYESADAGLTWSRHQVDPTGTAKIIKLLDSGDAWLALTSAQAGSPSTVFYSTDGSNWSPATWPQGAAYNDSSAAFNGEFVVIKGVTAYYSADALTWTARAQSPEFSPWLFVYDDVLYMEGGGQYYSSEDGHTWRYLVPTQGNLIELDGLLHAYTPSWAPRPVRLADVIVEAVSVPAPGSYGIGDSLPVRVNVSNHGRVALPDVEVNLYLSRDGFHGNGDDLDIGTYTLSAAELPPPDAAGEIEVVAVLPTTLEGGVFRLGARLDPSNLVDEFNESNNRGMSNDAPVNVPEWTLDIQTVGDGGVAQSVSAVRYVHGSTVTLTPSAGKNVAFSGWSGSESSERPDLTLTMRGDKSLQASFARVWQLSVDVAGAGEVVMDQPTGRYTDGATASLQAVPASGWRFVGWEEDLSGGTAAATLGMSTDRVVRARFDYPMANWKAAHFSSGELVDADVSGDAAAPGPLGITNRLSYLAGRDPRSTAAFNEPPEIRDSQLFYRYTRNTGAVGSTLIAEASLDLIDWSLPFEERVIDSVDGVETVEVIVPRTARQRVFIRLREIADE
ncbi:MAG: S8 family serine peptidase [Verrucomicrobiota bacterium]